MTEPTTKREVLDAMRGSHSEMDAFLASLTPDQITAPGPDGWSLQDALAHIAAWETMLAGWIERARRGETVKRFAPGFVYNSPAEREPTMHRLNHKLYLDNRGRALADVRADFNAAHQHLLATVDSLSGPELFESGHFAWCGDAPLIGWIAGDTWEHYAEHRATAEAHLARSA